MTRRTIRSPRADQTLYSQEEGAARGRRYPAIGLARQPGRCIKDGADNGQAGSNALAILSKGGASIKAPDWRPHPWYRSPRRTRSTCCWPSRHWTALSIPRRPRNIRVESGGEGTSEEEGDGVRREQAVGLRFGVQSPRGNSVAAAGSSRSGGGGESRSRQRTRDNGPPGVRDGQSHPAYPLDRLIT